MAGHGLELYVDRAERKALGLSVSLDAICPAASRSCTRSASESGALSWQGMVRATVDAETVTRPAGSGCLCGRPRETPTLATWRFIMPFFGGKAQLFLLPLVLTALRLARGENTRRELGAHRYRCTASFVIQSRRYRTPFCLSNGI